MNRENPGFPNCTPSQPHYSTLLALVQSLADTSGSEDELVATAFDLVDSGRVVLTGNFKGCRLGPELAG